MPTVPCKLSGCSEEHQLRYANNKAATPFFICDGIGGGSTIWIRTQGAQAWISNGGGRGNFSGRRTRKTNPKMDSMDRFLSSGSENEEEKAVCATCGAEVEEGVERCPRCHKELDWPEETKENPQDVEEESVLAKAARMTNEERARFIEERQRKFDQMYGGD